MLTAYVGQLGRIVRDDGGHDVGGETYLFFEPRDGRRPLLKVNFSLPLRSDDTLVQVERNALVLAHRLLQQATGPDFERLKADWRESFFSELEYGPDADAPASDRPPLWVVGSDRLHLESGYAIDLFDSPPSEMDMHSTSLSLGAVYRDGHRRKLIAECRITLERPAAEIVEARFEAAFLAAIDLFAVAGTWRLDALSEALEAGMRAVGRCPSD